MSNLLYNKNTVIGRLFCYFSVYFKNVPAPTAESLFLLLVSMLALESAHSIRFLYQHFLSKVTEKSLNAFYYACSYAKADYSTFMNTTIRIALNIIPKSIAYHPVFLCIDDTMVPKSGKKFEHISKLYDHAAHNGSSYLNGHCFVSIMLCIPVWKNRKISYLSIPLGYRMWDKSKSKLQLAADMVRQVMPELAGHKQVILLFDSWYAKRDLLCVVDEFSNLDILCGARSDTVLYDLAPPHTGKPGRPKKRGERLSLQTDFLMSKEKIGGYFLGYRFVLTNLFGKRKVLAYATSANETQDNRRLFLSTIFPENLRFACAWFEDAPINQTGWQWMDYLPFFLYKIRWNIEVSYYEQKSFWSLCCYMVRHQKGMEMLVNLINLAYSATKLLPYVDTNFSSCQTQSTQEFRFLLSEQIREQVIFTNFAQSLENGIKTKAILTLLKQKVFGFHSHTQNL